MFEYDSENYCMEDKERNISICRIGSNRSYKEFRIRVGDYHADFIAELTGDSAGRNVWNINRDSVLLEESGDVVDELVVEMLTYWGASPDNSDLSIPSNFLVSFRRQFR